MTKCKIYEMLVATIKAVKAVPNNKGLGVIYWEPQGEKWSGYALVLGSLTENHQQLWMF
jgi:arabinogalactan endo-1,4-beta-galactosidase